MLISKDLVPSMPRSDESQECTEDAFFAAYDGCLSYLEAHVDDLAKLGFDTSQLLQQQASADRWPAPP